jgi:hypothetical protein
MYKYEEEKKNLFTEGGMEMFIKIRDNVQQCLKKSGAVTAEKAMSTVTGSSWTMLACLDKMVEMGELREITRLGEVAGQHRIFVGVTNV